MAVNLDPTRRTAVRRLRNIYEATPDEVRQAGLDWYGKVHDAALNGLRDNPAPGRTIRHAAGVIAAVSPNMDWEKSNIGAFDEISSLSGHQWDAIRTSARGKSRSDEARDALQGLSISKASDSALMKAHRIWVGGEDFDRVLDRRGAPKTNSFAHNILNPGQPGPVTVDGRHADIIADSMRKWESSGRGISSASTKTGKVTRYEDYENHTRAAARGYGILPHQLQAVVWEQGKRIERGFDPTRQKGDPRVGQSYQRRLSEFQAGLGLA